MACCRDLCSTLFRCWLFIFNLLDAVCGVALIAYGIWCEAGSRV
jgi:hypothetical protein